MKSIRTIAALIAVIGMSSFAQAGRHRQVACGASKCCDCAPTFQPTCCKPTIVRPCHRNVYNYQRSCVKSTGCDAGCGPAGGGCCPTGAGNGCGTGTDNCAGGNGTGCVGRAGANTCAAPCGAGNGCGNGCVGGAGANTCAAPCGAGNGAGCVGGAGNGCAAPCGAGNGCGTGCVGGAGNGCADPGCAAPCGDSCCATTNNSACEIAQLIYTSQTACYPRQRRAALAKLGRKYDCVCNPEIMSAFIYGLNDADHRVRRTAADKIGDELRKNKCCCSQCTVEALTVALADCDRGVRRQAEQALKQCGYDIVDPCTQVACDTGCVGNGGAGCDGGNGCGNGNSCVGTGCVGGNCGSVPMTAPAAAPSAVEPAAAPAVAPAPPADTKAYFPKRMTDENARPVSAHKKSLNNLFGLAR